MKTKKDVFEEYRKPNSWWTPLTSILWKKRKGKKLWKSMVPQNECRMVTNILQNILNVLIQS